MKAPETKRHLVQRVPARRVGELRQHKPEKHKVGRRVPVRGDGRKLAGVDPRQRQLRSAVQIGRALCPATRYPTRHGIPHGTVFPCSTVLSCDMLTVSHRTLTRGRCAASTRLLVEQADPGSVRKRRVARDIMPRDTMSRDTILWRTYDFKRPDHFLRIRVERRAELVGLLPSAAVRRVEVGDTCMVLAAPRHGPWTAGRGRTQVGAWMWTPERGAVGFPGRHQRLR